MYPLKTDIHPRGARIEAFAKDKRPGYEAVEVVLDAPARSFIDVALHEGHTSGTVRGVVGWRRVGAMAGVLPDLVPGDVSWAVDSI